MRETAFAVDDRCPLAASTVIGRQGGGLSDRVRAGTARI